MGALQRVSKRGARQALRHPVLSLRLWHNVPCCSHYTGGKPESQPQVGIGVRRYTVQHIIPTFHKQMSTNRQDKEVVVSTLSQTAGSESFLPSLCNVVFMALDKSAVQHHENPTQQR